MNFTYHLAAFFEWLKFKNPKVFLVVQGALIAFLAVLEFEPEWITQFVTLSEKTVSFIKVFAAGSGILSSTSTTKYLSPEHDKVKAIEAENLGEIDPEKYKL